MPDRARKACIAGAQAGGRVLLQHFRKLTPGQIEEKALHDFVTDADRASEAAIRAELAHHFPGYGFLGEEGGFIPPGSRGSGGTQRSAGPGGTPASTLPEEGGFIPPESGNSLRWIVDPLDGTLNFLQGLPHWCVSVGLWDAEGPVAGCILDPLKGDRFDAARGGGARWNDGTMSVSHQGGLEGAFLATGFAFQLGERFPVWRKALDHIWPRAKGIRRAGSAALDLAYVACGIYDGFFELGLKPWDMAAGILLIHEAGGSVSDWQGGGTWWESGDLVAGNPHVHQDIVRVLRASGLG